jgi:hypothetical protein
MKDPQKSKGLYQLPRPQWQKGYWMEGYQNAETLSQNLGNANRGIQDPGDHTTLLQYARDCL